MNTSPEETLVQPEEQAPVSERQEEQFEQPHPEPVPELPVRPLASTKADLEKHLAGFKAFVAELESTQARLEQVRAQEDELLSLRAAGDEQEQLERLTWTLALKQVLERKLEQGRASGAWEAAGELGSAAAAALRSLPQELGDLRAKREAKHLATLKKLVADEQQWPWAEKYALALIRHFPDIRVIDTLALSSADYSLSHGAVEMGAEQVLADIGTFESESGSRPARARGCATPA